MLPGAIGPYEVVRELGRGGMGVVYEVRHPDLPGRRLALKVITSTFADAESLERFRREAELLASVRHPNVVAVHALGKTDEGRPYLVTALVEGTSLKAVARSERMAPSRVVAIVRSLASAVEALHDRGILHRDLKPENVILGAGDVPVLLDFGLARDVDARTLTRTGALLGTPAYMSPEQASGDKTSLLDARTDVYGLGAILFELLAGRAPFDGAPLQVIAAVIRKEPRWPSADRNDVPPALEAVLRRAMAKERDARPGSAAALGRELDACLSAATAAPRGGRGRAAIVGAVVAVTALASGLALAIGGRAPKHDPAPERTPGVGVAPVESHEAPRPRRSPAQSYPAYYRTLVTWLSEHPAHRDRESVEADVAKIRSSTEPLLRVRAGDSRQTVRFITDLQVAVAGGEPTVRLLDLKSKAKPTPEPLWPPVLKEGRRLHGLAVGPPLPDGRIPVVASISESANRFFFPYARGVIPPTEELVSFPHEGRFDPQGTFELPAVAISPDGEHLALGGAWKDVHVHALRSKGSVAKLGPHPTHVSATAFSPDGKRLVTGTKIVRDGMAEVRLWNVAQGTAPPAWRVAGHVRMIAFAPDGESFVVVAGTTMRVPLRSGGAAGDPERLDLREGSIGIVFARQPQSPFDVYGATSTDVAYAQGSIVYASRLGPGSTTTLLRKVPREGPLVSSLDLSPDGTLLAVAGTDRSEWVVEIWPAWCHGRSP